MSNSEYKKEGRLYTYIKDDSREMYEPLKTFDINHFKRIYFNNNKTGDGFFDYLVDEGLVKRASLTDHLLSRGLIG